MQAESSMELSEAVDRVGDAMRFAVDEIHVNHPFMPLVADVNAAGDIEIREADQRGAPLGPVLKTVRRIL
jgi:hypothetical protein